MGKKRTEKALFQINQLKPEKISSYIYYHYQYQEEYPGDWDKYGSIYLFGDLLVFYLENPTEVETIKTVGLLTSKNTPIDTWDTLMQEHFADRWRPVKNLEHNAYIAFGLKKGKTIMEWKKDEILGGFPDIFTCNDGRKLESKEQWPQRREELLNAIVPLLYGGLPPKPEVLLVEKPYSLRGLHTYSVKPAQRTKQCPLI